MIPSSISFFIWWWSNSDFSLTVVNKNLPHEKRSVTRMYHEKWKTEEWMVLSMEKKWTKRMRRDEGVLRACHTLLSHEEDLERKKDEEIEWKASEKKRNPSVKFLFQILFSRIFSRKKWKMYVFYMNSMSLSMTWDQGWKDSHKVMVLEVRDNIENEVVSVVELFLPLEWSHSQIESKWGSLHWRREQIALPWHP